MGSEHNNVCIHSRAVLTGPERSRKGASLPVAQLVFHEFDQETAQRFLQITIASKISRQGLRKSSFIIFSSSKQLVYEHHCCCCLPAFPWLGWRRQAACGVRMKYSKYFGCYPSPPTPPTPRPPFGVNISKVPNMVTSQSPREPGTANDMWPSPWEEPRKKGGRRGTGGSWDPLHWASVLSAYMTCVK